MKLSSLALGAATILIAAPVITPAFAQTSTNVTVTGQVGKQCGVGNQSGGGTRSLGPSITVPDLVTTDGQLNLALSTPIGFDNVWCNAPSTIKMDVSPMKLQSPPAFDASSFTATLDMNVTGDSTHQILATYFAGATKVASTNGAIDGTVSNSIPAFETGTLTYSEALLSYTIPANGHSQGIRPLAGQYTGTVTVTATPN
ncbi:MAG TPA: hypothetical protein VHW60_20645 [Caulobacteraceae bacterium]|jgi:hypothetical protein|nr:hypothetical protein [Caulobacteraceae bacterium]